MAKLLLLSSPNEGILTIFFFVGSKAKMFGDELGIAKLEHVCGEEANHLSKSIKL